MKTAWVLAAGFFVFSNLIWASEPLIHHDLVVAVDPSTHGLRVSDKISGMLPANLVFSLHSGLGPVSSTPGVALRAGVPHWVGGVSVTDYELQARAPMSEFTLEYSGPIFEPQDSNGETAGLIGEEGVHLASSSFWIPRFGNEFVSFTLDVHGPAEWSFVSQETTEPQEEIYLIGGKFSVYQKQEEGLNVLAYLRTPDPELAEKYMAVTAKTIRNYSVLLGPYAYRKFALVENFWETGYGMPSFTLLGPSVIRLPFIVNTSYPHEILHNWWGNGVYVDYDTGNWCEGLTAYLADHAYAAQTGADVDYRRTALQQYRDYVSENNDIPLTEFRERHNASTETIGYGKALMADHMLRSLVGDELFFAGLKKFYTESKFKRASWFDLKAAFEAVSGLNLSGFFSQWIERTGAPELRVSQVAAGSDPAGGFLLSAHLEQVQAGEAYELRIPIEMQFQGAGVRAEPYLTQLQMKEKILDFGLHFDRRPERLIIDPRFDVFRRMDRLETPPAVSQIFGAKKLLIVLPTAVDSARFAGFKAMAEGWTALVESGDVLIKKDSDLAVLPTDSRVWVLGWENRFAAAAFEVLKPYGVVDNPEAFSVGAVDYTKGTHSILAVGRRLGDPESAIGFVGAVLGSDEFAAIGALARKIPHYGKYGFVVFQGSASTKVAQGVWPVLDSPLSVEIK
ncbi:M1 family aminopeptidase [Bdellovibrionota bacterium FG-2]